MMDPKLKRMESNLAINAEKIVLATHRAKHYRDPGFLRLTKINI